MSETMLLTIGIGLIIIGAVLMAYTVLTLLREDRLTPDSVLSGIAGVALVLVGAWFVSAAASP